MGLLYDALVVLHLVGMAMLLGGWLLVIRSPRIPVGMWHGALTQLVTGVALVGLRESGAVDRPDLDQAKISVKLAVALVVAVLVFLNRKNRERVAPGALHAIGGLALVNVVIAVFW